MLPRRAAFSLIEVLIAIAIVGVIVTGLGELLVRLQWNTNDYKFNTCIYQYKVQLAEALGNSHNYSIPVTDARSNDGILATITDPVNQQVFRCINPQDLTIPIGTFWGHAGECIPTTGVPNGADQRETFFDRDAGDEPATLEDSEKYGKPIRVWASGTSGFPPAGRTLFLDSTLAVGSRAGLRYPDCQPCNFDVDPMCLARVLVRAHMGVRAGGTSLHDNTRPNIQATFIIAEMKNFPDGSPVRIDARRARQTFTIEPPLTTGCYPNSRYDGSQCKYIAEFDPSCDESNYPCRCSRKTSELAGVPQESYALSCYPICSDGTGNQTRTDCAESPL